MTVEASCHCGRCVLVLDHPPADVTECNCSICRRYAVLWAYYTPLAQVDRVRLGATDVYQWNDRGIEFHRCAACGCVTHWWPVDAARDRCGVNARLLAPEVLAQARVRHLDGAVSERYRDEN